MALTTLSGVNAYKGWTAGDNTTRDAQVTSLIDSISTRFETHSDRKFNSTSRTEYHDSDGGPYLYLNQYPITAITSIWNDTNWVWGSDTLISGTDYRIMENGQGIIFKNYLTKGRQNIKALFVAGYVTIPYDLRDACNEEVADQWKDSTRSLGTIKARTLPDGSVQYGDGGGSASTPPFRATTMDILERYRNKHII